MNDSDKQAFKKLMDMTCDYYGKEHLNPVALKMYFDLMADRTVEQFTKAVTLHMKDPDQGRFMPKVADFERHMVGKQLTADSVLANARNPQDTFGVQCRVHIGSHDLSNCTDAFYLKQRAQECIELCSKWEQEAAQGLFAANLIEATRKHGIDPRKPYRDGLPTPLNQENLTLQVNQYDAEHRRALQLENKNKPAELTEEQKAKNLEKMKQIIAGV